MDNHILYKRTCAQREQPIAATLFVEPHPAALTRSRYTAEPVNRGFGKTDIHFLVPAVRVLPRYITTPFVGTSKDYEVTI